MIEVMRTVQRDIVGAFIFSSDGRIALGKIRRGGVYRGQWVVPGGGVEPGETKLQAVKREIQEELGLDLDEAEVTPTPFSPPDGESEKTLRETGERVLVHMRFYNFEAHFKRPAADLLFKLQDDLVEAQWFPLEQLPNILLSPPTDYRLRKMGHLKV